MASSFDANVKKVEQSLVGGPFFEKPIMPAPMKIVDGIDPSVRKAMQTEGAIKQSTPLDAWNERRAKTS